MTINLAAFCASVKADKMDISADLVSTLNFIIALHSSGDSRESNVRNNAYRGGNNGR